MFNCCKKSKAKEKGKRKRGGIDGEDPEEAKAENIFGYSLMGYGKKKINCQDTTCIMENFDENMSYFAVYDGHGFAGREASLLANESIESILRSNSGKMKKMANFKQLQKFLINMCSKVQDKFKKLKIYDFTLSGTCAIMVLIIGNICYVSNLGDSRCVVGNIDNENNISALELSIDHKPFRDCERDRILKSGGKIEKSMVDDREIGPLRVWKADEDVPGIAITRSLGDLTAHRIGVIAEPEISFKELTEDDKFIVIGSDGVWDVMSSAEAVGFVLQCKEKEKAAQDLVEECKERWDLLNEIKRKQTQIMLENTETDKKKANDKLQQLEKNIVRDDISIVIAYLQ